MKKLSKNSIFLIQRGPTPAPWPWHFLHDFWRLSVGWDSNLWPWPRALPPLTTVPHYHLWLYCIFFSHILSKTEHELIVWGLKRIQINKLSTIKFHNFSRSTTFILIVSPSEVVYKIWISNLRNSNVVFVDKMISNKKVVDYKVS